MSDFFLHNTQISWFGFIIVLLTGGLFLIGYFGLLKPLLSRYERFTQWQYQEIAVDRIIIFIVLSYIMLAFVLVNPLVHGFLVFFIILFSIQNLRSFIQGILLIFETKLKLGNYVEVDHKQGVVGNIGLTSLRIDSENQSHFIKYKNIDKKGISISKSNISTKIHSIECSLVNDKYSEKEIIKLVQNAFFSFPFLNSNIPPQFVKNKDKYRVRFALKSDEFYDTIVENLTQRGIKIHH